MTRPAASPLIIGAPDPAISVVEIEIRLFAGPGTGPGNMSHNTGGARIVAP